LTIEIDNSGQSPEQSQLLVSAGEARVDRVNVMAYGPPGSGKTYFATTFPKPFFIDTENGLITARARITKGEIDDFPAIQTTDFTTVLEILSAPKYRIPALFKGTKWEGYTPETLVIDTISTLEGHIFDEIQESAGKVAQPQWNALKRKMMALARKAWDCDLNTVILAHDQSGRQASADMGAKEPGPLLTGTLVKQFPAQIDLLLRFQQLMQPGGVKEYVAHSVTSDGMPARAQGVDLDALIENPSYATLRMALDKL
jgi:hypothetical protein